MTTVSTTDQSGKVLQDPEFIISNPVARTLDIYALEDSQIGKYVVNIEARLDNILGSTT